MRLSEEEFARLVDEALALLPRQFRQWMENITVDIQPRPTRELTESAEMPPDRRLLGLYHGVPVTEQSVEAPWGLPERIYIFQRNIEAACRTRQEIVQQVRITVLHEIGHHFGFSDEELEALGMD